MADAVPDPSPGAVLRERVRDAVERLAADAVALSTSVRDHPELGYAETATAERVRQWLARHGHEAVGPLARTGSRAAVHGGSPGPTVALLGELDAVHVPGHPRADPVTGAAHACGHHASLAAACAAFVAVAEVAPDLAGRLVLLTTPAEELLPRPERDRVAHAGDVHLPTGKAELVRAGVLDDVDLALMVHAGRGHGPRFSVGDTLNAAARVSATFTGTAAHAGSSPWLGVDAVRAARLAMDAVDAQRDGFADTDAVRVAQQLLAPAGAPGATPATCRVELVVRARTLEALRLALTRVDRALHAGATAMGAGLRRTRELAYVPLRSCEALDDVVAGNAVEVLGPHGHARGRHLGASSDAGDLGLVVPVAHPYSSGTVGHHHGIDFDVVDHDAATVQPATYLALSVVDLLADGAAGAARVLARAPARMTREEYLEMRERWSGSRETWPVLDPEESTR